jgi:hypothetical protein
MTHPRLTLRRVSAREYEVYEGSTQVATLGTWKERGLAQWAASGLTMEMRDALAAHPIAIASSPEACLAGLSKCLHLYRTADRPQCVPQCVHRSVKGHVQRRVAPELPTSVATLGGVTTYRVPGCAHGGDQ